MISAVSWLWKQFRGPQISAVCQAIFDYIKTTIDFNLEYWNKFSINTANDKHLTLLGAMQNLARPIIEIQADEFQLFTEVPMEGTYYPSDPYKKSDHGLSAISNLEYGGRFSEVGEAATYTRQQLPAPLFRTILRGASDSEAVIGSLAYLDDILWRIWCVQQGTDENVAPYTFKILKQEDLEQYFKRACGDIILNIGRDLYWADPNQIIAEFNLLGRTVYFPTPTLYATADY